MHKIAIVAFILLLSVLCQTSAAPNANVVTHISPRFQHPPGWQPMRRPKPADTGKRETKPKWHSVIIPPKVHHPPIRWYDKINPIWWLGNIDEPSPPAWYEPHNSMRKIMWYFRNPFTNLAYYVIGVADKKTVRSGWYPTQIGNPNGGWNFAVTRRRILFLPFVDYKNSRLEFYFGWRERGNFGIKLVFHRTPEKLQNDTRKTDLKTATKPAEVQRPTPANEEPANPQ